MRRACLITRYADGELARIGAALRAPIFVEHRTDVDRALDRLCAQPGEACIVELIGHTRPDGRLLLGDWTVDADQLGGADWTRRGALAAAGVQAIRILGCGSASTTSGARHLHALSLTLGIEIFGTTNIVLATCFDEHGFRDDYRFVLVPASGLSRAG